jgi:hypothetical protein
VLHQLEDEHRCPAHQHPLETHCPQCRGETRYIVNASVIEMPFRCVWCRSHFSYGRLSLRSTVPAMRRQDRIAHQPPIASTLAQLSRRRQVLSTDPHLLTPAPAQAGVNFYFVFGKALILCDLSGHPRDGSAK